MLRFRGKTYTKIRKWNIYFMNYDVTFLTENFTIFDGKNDKIKINYLLNPIYHMPTSNYRSYVMLQKHATL